MGSSDEGASSDEGNFDEGPSSDEPIKTRCPPRPFVFSFCSWFFPGLYPIIDLLCMFYL